MLNFITWNPEIDVFSIGSFVVRWYSLCWALGLAFAYFIVYKLYKQQKIEQKKFDPLFLYCFLGILIGARLGHCLLYEPGYFLSHPIEMILPIRNVDGGWRCTGYQGLASHGGTLGLMIALWLYVRKTKVNILRVLDNIAIATPLTAACIRMGNLVNSEIVGAPTTEPWGFIFVANGETFARHPAQLYEALFYFALFFVGWILYKKQPEKVGSGWFFGLCLTAIFTFRFLVEFIKESQEGWEDAMRQAIGLDQGQLLSIPFVLLGLYCLFSKKLSQKWGETSPKK